MNRPDTSIEHLLSEFRADIPETVLAHIDETVALHDLKRDGGLQPNTRENLFDRSVDNFNNRAVHQHIFSFRLLECIGYLFQMKVRHLEFGTPFHQMAILQKSGTDADTC